MAAFTITTGTPAAPTNTDTLVGRTGGDTLAINGGFVVQDEDSRYGLNANTSATWSSITPSSTLGGSMLFDGRAIWLIPYTGGSGNVPAYNTAITLGSATGKHIGVYSALNVAPTTPGSAMPATGYIKVKQWNGVLYGTGALGGITATAASGENVGWIEPVCQESSLALVSSLNQAASGSYDGSFVKGDWYTVGTTDGNRATSYQIPTNGSLVWHGAVMVDKAAATTITAATWSGGVATFTSTAHGLTTDDRVFVGVNILPRTWRTVDTQRCTVIDANTFTVPMTTNPGAYVSGGKVAAQEWWPITDSLNTKVGTEDYRGKHCWLDSTTGLLRFGNDNITSTGGAVPSTGRVIRLPNVMSQMATVATKTANSLAASVNTRWRYYNGNAGTIKVDHLSGSWSASVFQTGKYVQMSDSTVVNQISCSSQAAPCTFTNIAVGGNGNTTAVQAFLLSSMPSGTTVLDSVFSVGEFNSRYPLSLSTAYAVTVDRCTFTGTGDRGAATYSVNCNIGSGATFTRCKFGPLGLLTSSQFSNGSMSNCSYYSAAYSFNQITSPTATINLSNLSANWSFTDFTLYGPTPLARNTLLTAASSSDNPVLRNWGTLASPIDMRINGSKYWQPWTRVTTTATITETGHPYRVGDQCMIFNSSASGTLTAVVKTISAVTANTFDVPAVNSGATSGTCSYYVGNILAVLNLNTVANAVVQNVHVRGNVNQPTTTSNNQYGMKLDNFTCEPQLYAVSPIVGANDMQVRSAYTTDYPIITQQTSVFGTHFSDVFVREPGTAVPGQSAAVTGCAWTRTLSTCTVTSPNHGIVNNLQRIWIENSSSTAAVTNGWGGGSSGITLIPIDANTFTITCLNAGAASGTLDYWLAGDSQFRVMMTEPSANTTAQAAITVNAGQAGFTGAGTLVLPVVGDQATWETSGFIKGYDSFGHTPAIPYGGALTTIANTQQFDLEYALDRGSGFGAWRNAAHYGSSVGGWGNSGSTAVTVTKSSGIQVNDYCSGTGIATNAQFVSRTPGKLAMNSSASVASAPDSAALQLTGSFTLDAKLTLANWSAPTATTGCIVAKGDSSTLTKGYYLRFTSTGALTLAIGTGAAAVSAQSSVSLSTVLTNGVASWVRAVWDEPADQAKFYYSSDGSSWTQLGTTQALVGSAVGTSASTFYIGQRTTGNDYLTADIYRVRVYSDATQTTKVFDADFSTNTTGAATLTESVNSAVVTTTGCQEVTLSAVNTAAVSGVLTWWYTPNETSFPSTGVKFKIRATANTAQAASFYQIDMPLLSSNTTRARLYPQTTSVPLSITAVDSALVPIQNARVYIKAAAGGPETLGTVLLTGVTNASGVLTGTYGYSSSQPITGWVRKSTGSPTYKQALVAGTITSTGYSTTVFLVKDE